MRKTTILLAAIGLLLVGVAVTRTPGQQVAVGDGACCYPTGCLDQTQTSCIFNGGTSWHPGTTCAETDCTPQPTVVGLTSVFIPNSLIVYIYRAWSDGRLDRVQINDNAPCAVADVCVIIPGTCTTDIDRDGDTGINDFLTLLGGWGPCP